MVIRRQARRSLKAYSPRTCPTAAFRTASSTRFFGSPTAAHLCPNSNLPPTSSDARSPPAAALLPELHAHPSRRTSPSSHRSCAWTLPLPAPHPPPFVPPPPASMLRSFPLLCACSSTYFLPSLFHEIIPSVRKEGSRSAGYRPQRSCL